jgi:hypothetical protein
LEHFEPKSNLEEPLHENQSLPARGETRNQCQDN